MPNRIIITKAPIGGRFVVTFVPRAITRPSLEFRSHSDAMRCADARHKAHGWTIEDQTEEGRTNG
ncbi:hypothetical protein GS397_00760 [Sphingobium yanoikuyae]|uniref:DUF2188 domain-containing protein n=1 Tax=Sphingobium yanoikuyae TaxID=13690 RepID=A0A6P1GC52_SPHYA|nr:hypothetical protein [Sphingobium yanoikuyae]QHD65743.1 hypothetical protein GS397_00760 [Sphingobium yanoikuyae]